MKNWIIIFLFTLTNLYAQIHIEYLNDVPTSFKQKYFSQKRNYNPLQVGNIWQFYEPPINGYEGYYRTIKIEKDTLINNIKYFKKVYYSNQVDFISCERNDSNGNIIALDILDVNNDGSTDDEIPIDSLSLPTYSRFLSFKFVLEPSSFVPYEAYISDSSWVEFYGDTLLLLHVQYGLIFVEEDLVDRIGLVKEYGELVQPSEVFGIRINNKVYGTIVNVEDRNAKNTNFFALENNYPNPFNPSTTISYSIPQFYSAKSINVKLLIYNSLGEVVRTLVNESQSPGKYTVEFNAEGLASGVYYYSLVTNTNKITKPMILVK